MILSSCLWYNRNDKISISCLWGSMKYLKLVLAGLLVIISSCQYFIYGFIDDMIFWLLYSIFYFAVGLYQKFHKSSILSQICTLIYICVPLAALTIYSIKEGLSQITETFYIVFMVALALALIWEIISLCLVIKEKSDEKKRKQ